MSARESLTRNPTTLATMIDAALIRWETEGRIKPMTKRKKQKGKPNADDLAHLNAHPVVRPVEP